MYVKVSGRFSGWINIVSIPAVPYLILQTFNLNLIKLTTLKNYFSISQVGSILD